MSTLEVREPFRKENTPSPMIRYEVMDDLKAKSELSSLSAIWRAI